MEIIKKEEIELLKKLNILRKEVKDNLTKSGKNDYSHFTYFQLKDFLPIIVDECAEKQELFIIFDMQDEKVEFPCKKTKTTSGETVVEELSEDFNYVEYAYLTVIDLTSGFSKVYKRKTKDATVSGATAIQNLGAKSTYMKRYLYMDLLEVAEDDQVDAPNNEKIVEQPKVSTPPTPKVNSKKEIKKEEPKKEEVKVEEKIDESDDAILSIADREEIGKIMIENNLDSSILVEIAKNLGYSSPIEIRAKQKEAVISAIKEKVGK